MNALFADAGYWIALFNPRDQLHERAIAVSRALEDRPILTSQMVLTEFLDHYASLGSRLRVGAATVVRSLRENTAIEIVPQSAEQFEAALAFYAQRHDKAWGVTDFASFLIMQERGLVEALAYDEHYAQAGFVPLLREQ